jgi:hypothetical protein
MFHPIGNMATFGGKDLWPGPAASKGFALDLEVFQRAEKPRRITLNGELLDRDGYGRLRIRQDNW